MRGSLPDPTARDILRALRAASDLAAQAEADRKAAREQRDAARRVFTQRSQELVGRRVTWRRSGRGGRDVEHHGTVVAIVSDRRAAVRNERTGKTYTVWIDKLWDEQPEEGKQ